MFYISEIQTEAPKELKTDLQKKVYSVLNELNINFKRVDTQEAITMDDCILINQKLEMEMVKTLFLCNRQQTEFYLVITVANKPFKSKEFSQQLNIARLSFAPVEVMQQLIGTTVGAATIFGTLLDEDNKIKVVFDEDLIKNEFYGCSDGLTTSYMKIKTDDILSKFLKYTKHQPIIVKL